MKRSRFNADALCFPLPPARIGRAEAPLLPAVAATYLSEILRWRNAVAAAVAAGDPAITTIENLTPRARSRLLALLRTEWDAKTRSWAAASDYDLTPFPLTREPGQGGDPMTAVLEVLHWRAAVIYYLTDVWDAMGKPELEMGECAAIGEFIRPARLEGCCVYCLSEFKADRLDPDAHGCLMGSRVGVR